MDLTQSYSQTPEILNKHSKHTSKTPSPTKSSYECGLEKFSIIRKNKDLLTEIQQISNKIQSIQKFESQIKRRYSQEKYQSDLIQQKKSRNNYHRQQKEQFYKEKLKEIEQQKQKNLSEKQRRSQTIKAIKESILKEKIQYARSLKKQRKELDILEKSTKTEIKKQKFLMKSKRIQEVIQHKTRVNLFSLKNSESLKKSYEDRIAQEKAWYLELLQKKAELERQELQVFEKYSKTLQNSPHNALITSINI